MALATEFCRYQSDAGSHVTHPQSCDKVNKWCHKITFHLDISLPSGMHSDAAIETALSNAVFKLGYQALRPHQKTAITSFVQGRDVFVCLPTGQLAVGSPGADTGFSKRGVETRDTKIRKAGGGGVAVRFRPDTKKQEGGAVSFRPDTKSGGGGGGGGVAVKQKRGRYLI